MCVELAKNAVWIPSQGVYYIYGFMFKCKIMSNYAYLLLFNPLSVQVLYLLYLLYCSQILEAMLTIAQTTCTLHFVFICFTLTPGLFPSWNNINNLC